MFSYRQLFSYFYRIAMSYASSDKETSSHFNFYFSIRIFHIEGEKGVTQDSIRPSIQYYDSVGPKEQVRKITSRPFRFEKLLVRFCEALRVQCTAVASHFFSAAYVFCILRQIKGRLIKVGGDNKWQLLPLLLCTRTFCYFMHSLSVPFP